jgi:FAD dependent oxidoreductase
MQVRELEPNLHPEVIGGWWFPEDASVDSRRLTKSLRAACVSTGVQILHGPSCEVTSLDLIDGTCRGLWLKNGKYITVKSVLVANGAWMRNLVPVPIQPHKGQSVSLRMPPGRPPILRRVLFAQDSYIVPKADGRIVVGATVEVGSYDGNITPAGLLHILTHALQLVPALQDLPVEETWVGLRPTTPDKGPILGGSPWNNLFLAGGYWRNGVLLAPKTGQLSAQLLCGDQVAPLSHEDKALLSTFSWDRFTTSNPGRSLQVSATARYTAAMHPVQSRSSGSGVSAAVGTELGVYSTARDAADERARDRESLLSAISGGDSGDLEAAFERAALLGQRDGSAYSFGQTTNSVPSSDDDVELLERFGGTADALTVSASTQEENSESEPFGTMRTLSPSTSREILRRTPAPEGNLAVQTPSNLESVPSQMDMVYSQIRENKSRAGIRLDASATAGSFDGEEELGVKIFYKDEESGEGRPFLVFHLATQIHVGSSDRPRFDRILGTAVHVPGRIF